MSNYAVTPFALLSKSAAAMGPGDQIIQGAQQGAATGATGALQTDLGDVNAGMARAAGGAGNLATGSGRAALNAVSAPVHAIGAGIHGGATGAWNTAFPKAASVTAFAALEKSASALNSQHPFAPNAPARPHPNHPMYPNKSRGGLIMPGSPEQKQMVLRRGANMPKQLTSPSGVAGAGGNGLWGPGGSDALANAGAHGRQVTQFTGPQTSNGTGQARKSQGVNVDSPEGRALQAGFEPQTAAAPVASGPDFMSEFKKYHASKFDPNSSMDRRKMEQLQQLYASNGSLSAADVYKSASVTAFAALGGDMEKSAMVGSLLRGAGSFLGRSAAKAQKTHKVGFQNYYKGLDDAARARTPGLKQRAMQYQSSSPAELGKQYNIGQWRQNLGQKMQTVGDDLGMMRFTNPNASRLVDAGTGAAAVGTGAVALNAGQRAMAPVPQQGDAGIAKSASLTAFASLECELEKAALAAALQKGLGWGAQRLGASAHKARVALKGKADEAATSAYDATMQARKGQRGMAGRGIAEENARVAGKGVLDRGANVGSRRANTATALNQAANKLGDSPVAQNAINYGVGGVGGAGLLYGANRAGHSQGRESGISEGYDVGSEAALAQIPEAPGYLGGIMGAVMGKQPTDGAAIRNMLDQSKADILQTVLRGRA